MTDALTRDNARSENPAALNLRARLNHEKGSFDLAAWLRGHAHIGRGARLLDIGCGTGRLLMRYGEEALHDGRCVAIDISEASLRELRQAASLAGLAGLETACLDMDTLASPDAHTELRGFTHIVSAYALYYSLDAARLLAGLCYRLSPDGTLLVVAPAPGNNVEWFELLERAGVRLPDRILDVTSFLERTVLPFALRNFSSVQVEVATNTVRLESPEEIEAYWRSNVYFDAKASDAVRVSAAEICRVRGGLTNHKRIGLVTMRGRGSP